MKERKIIQIGQTAMRDPATGDSLPPIPLYTEADPDAVDGKTG